MLSSFLAIILIASAAPGAHTQDVTSHGFPPPGRMVDVGGRKLHLYCTGKGTPTVVLIPGGGAFSIDWALVQPKVAERTRVCSYDRAGLGWSDPGPNEETVEETVNDLHATLKASREKRPYVLVGASIAGIFIQAYQRAYGHDVAALVFSNSSNRIGLKVGERSGLIWDLSGVEIRSAFPLPAIAKKDPAPTTEDDLYDRLPPDLQKVRLWLDVRLWKKSDPDRATPDSILSWRNEFLREFEATDPGKKPPLSDLPVVVVSSAPPATEAERQSRDGAAARLDFLSSNTVHITAKGSGHEIHLYQPDKVIDGIVEAISAVRNKTRLSRPSMN